MRIVPGRSPPAIRQEVGSPRQAPPDPPPTFPDDQDPAEYAAWLAGVYAEAASRPVSPNPQEKAMSTTDETTNAADTNGTSDASRGPFATLAEANAAKPAPADVKGKRFIYAVTGPDGQTLYTWADGLGSALIYVARGLGHAAARHDKAPTREKVAGLIGQLSPEDQAILIAHFAAQVPPAPDKPTGKKGGGK